MKRFLRDIGLGLLVFLIFWGIAEYFFDRVQPLNVYNYKYNYVKDNSSIKTLLIGHSHFENSINPYLMGDSVFNFAISGRRWVYWDVELAKKLLHTIPNLKTVIFPLGYGMMFESQHYDSYADEFVLEYTYNYSKYMHVYYDRFPENIYYRSALLCNRMGTKYWKFYDSIDSLGYAKLTGVMHVEDDDEDSEIVSLTERERLCYEEFRTYFFDLAKICDDNQVRFVVVTCPCADCFKESTCEEGLLCMQKLIDDAQKRYQLECYNYLFDEEFRADSLYFNCTHLNTEGADKLAIRLINDMEGHKYEE